jgi:uncharacterized lipoprotein YehR (DUF1307 family)
MKKLIYVVLFLALIVLLKGCKEKEVITKCSLTDNQVNSGYKTKNEYEIYSKDEIVNKVTIKQVITSNNEELLNKFKKDLEESYKNNNSRYKGYSVKIDLKKNKLIAESTINYDKMDLNKFIKDNKAMKEFINKDNKLTLQGAKKMYLNIGAKCEE